jgi:hypothetical protein
VEEHPRPAHLDAEHLPRRTLRTVGRDRIGGANPCLLTALAVDHRRGNAVLVLAKRYELGLEAQIAKRVRLRGVEQDRFEPVLRAADARRRAVILQLLAGTAVRQPLRLGGDERRRPHDIACTLELARRSAHRRLDSPHA